MTREQLRRHAPGIALVLVVLAFFVGMVIADRTDGPADGPAPVVLPLTL